MTNRPKDGGSRRVRRLATYLRGVLLGRSRSEVDVLDLSLRGCLARGPSLLDRGLIMDLELQLDRETLSLKVRVADSSRDGEASSDEVPLYLTGLEFLSLPPGGEVQLHHFLDRELHRQRNRP